MKLDLLDNPLSLSLIIYVLISAVIYIKKPHIFDKNRKLEGTEEDNFFTRNVGVIFVLLPIIIYGCVSGLVNKMNRKKYCSLLKEKEIDIKGLLEKCKKK
jgi:hypothetical protein